MSRLNQVPFTPIKRSASSISSSSTTTAGSAGIGGSLKKFKATLSTETRSKFGPSHVKPPRLQPTISSTSRPGSSLDVPRPKTPSTPRAPSPSHSACLLPNTSEMDVSRVDPEEVLVHSRTMDLGDLSVESIDPDNFLSKNAEQEKKDKVLVSIRIRPSDENVWIVQDNSISLDPRYNKNSLALPSTHTFDHISHGTAPHQNTQKALYESVAKAHVAAAMDGYNAVVFAYGQTASGKSHTLTGSKEEPGIIPRSMKDVFAYIKRTPAREYLLRCSYLEIYNETVIDLLAPPSSASANQVAITSAGLGGTLREEVVINLDGVNKVLERGEKNRRTACTDWNDRSSRSHSVFRMVIESRERAVDGEQETSMSGRATPSLSGRATPGGTRLQSRGGRGVQTSVLSLIDLAGSEKATSDKERTKEGKYINTSLLQLGAVISTLAENASKGKSDHVPYRNSKLTRLLQPSLSGNSLIAVICTLNPGASAIAESTSTLGFAGRIKKVSLNATKKEVVGDVEALLERYRKEIEDLKTKLAERREADGERDGSIGRAGKAIRRRLSAREQVDESQAMQDLNARIHQLTRLILTSQNVDEGKLHGDGIGAESAASSPVKIDFDMEPWRVQQELLAARSTIETQATQILSLEAALAVKSGHRISSDDDERDRIIRDQAKNIRDLEESGAEGLEYQVQLAEEVKRREESELFASELAKALEKEKKTRVKLEEERRALEAFVRMFDSVGLGGTLPPTRLPLKNMNNPRTTVSVLSEAAEEDASPMKPLLTGTAPDVVVSGESLLETLPEEEWSFMDEVSFEVDRESSKRTTRVPSWRGRRNKENTRQ